MTSKTERIMMWVLRLAVGGEFLGHGVLALQGNEEWLGWIEQVLGADAATAITLLTLIGLLDVSIAVALLCWRSVPRVVLLWASFWGFFTALVPLMVGESIWEFVADVVNGCAPFTLLLLYGWPQTAQEWLVSSKNK